MIFAMLSLVAVAPDKKAQPFVAGPFQEGLSVSGAGVITLSNDGCSVSAQMAHWLS
jgi:hypothetical protein